jgi:hypothetical protein
MNTNYQFYRVYGKGGAMKQFKATDWNAGNFVGNLIFATFFESNVLEKLKKDVAETAKLNPDFKFQIRDNLNRIIFES